jgi:ferric-dicitrate binding protein FerR (iron transport regulator)
MVRGTLYRPRPAWRRWYDRAAIAAAGCASVGYVVWLIAGR